MIRVALITLLCIALSACGSSPIPETEHVFVLRLGECRTEHCLLFDGDRFEGHDFCRAQLEAFIDKALFPEERESGLWQAFCEERPFGAERAY